MSQELDKKIEEALACPCVDDLREGACGSQFTQAFTCYIKNMKADKVSSHSSSYAVSVVVVVAG